MFQRIFHIHTSGPSLIRIVLENISHPHQSAQPNQNCSRGPRANCSCRSSLICSFLKSGLSDSLPSLFTKERPWAICSGCLWQKSDVSDSLFFTSELLFCSFTHKKQANCSKRRWANSQPWPDTTCRPSLIKMRYWIGVWLNLLNIYQNEYLIRPGAGFRIQRPHRK